MTQVKDYRPIRGTCLSMCPRNEVILRQRENLIHKLECKIGISGERTQFSDSKRMVKEFSRPAAGQKIEAVNVRPLNVLQKTVNYLVSIVCQSDDVSWNEIYEFVENRLRSVRQDITVQALNSFEVTKVLVPIARFYIYANYRFCDDDDTIEFDPHLNLMQLSEVLLTILSIFRENPSHLSVPDIGLAVRDRTKELSENESEDEDIVINENSCIITDITDTMSNLNINDNLSGTARSVISNPSTGDTAGCREGETENTGAASNASMHNIDKTSDNVHINPPDNFIQSYAPYSNIRVATPSTETTETESAKKIGEKSVIQKRRLSAIHQYTVIEEMLALYLLIHLGNNQAITQALLFPEHVRCSDLVSRTIEAILSWELQGNYFPLTRLSYQLPPILCCAVHLHLNKIQRHALGVLSASHSSKQCRYAVKELQNDLLFSSPGSLLKVCSYYGLFVSEDSVQFLKSDFKWDLQVHKQEKAEWIDARLKDFTVSDIILP